MRKALCIGMIVFVCVGLVVSEQNGNFEIQAGIDFGSLLGGRQREAFDAFLSPTPDSYSVTGPGASIRYYFIDSLGVEVSCMYLPVSTKLKGYEPLRVLEAQVVNLGLSARLKVSDTDISKMFFDIGAGLNYSFLEYSDEFKHMVPELYEIKPSIGYYGYVGSHFYFGKTMYMGVNLVYEYCKGNIEESAIRFDGKYLLFPVYLGWHF